MKHLKTYEGFFDFFKKKEIDLSNDIINKFTLDEMKNIFTELNDDFGVDVDSKLKYCKFSRSFDDKKYIQGFTTENEIYYFKSNGITKETANCFQVSLRTITQDIYVDGNNLKEDNDLLEKLEVFLKYKSELNGFKYVIFKKLKIASSQLVHNMYYALIY